MIAVRLVVALCSIAPALWPGGCSRPQAPAAPGEKADKPAAGEKKTEGAQAGAPAVMPDVRIGKVDDIKAVLAAAKGKPVVIDIWATWCGPCCEMFPHLVELHRKHGSEGLVVLAVSIDAVEDIEGKVKPFLKQQGAGFPVLVYDMRAGDWDTAATVLNRELFPSEKYDGGVPVTLVYGRDGKLRKSFLSVKADRAELDAAVAAALAQ